MRRYCTTLIVSLLLASQASAAPVWFNFDGTITEGSVRSFQSGTTTTTDTTGNPIAGTFSLTDRAIEDQDPSSQRSEYRLVYSNSADYPALRDHRVIAGPVDTGNLATKSDLSLSATSVNISVVVTDGEAGQEPDTLSFSISGVRRDTGGSTPDDYRFAITYSDPDGTVFSINQFPQDYAEALALIREPADAGLDQISGTYYKADYRFMNSSTSQGSFSVNGISEPTPQATTTAQLISATASGEGGNGTSWDPTLSADGQLLAFSSTATDLTTDADPNGNLRDIFLMNRATGELRSLTAGANGPSEDPVLSKDGQWLAFVTRATNLPTDIPDSNGVIDDVILLEVATGALTLVTSGGNAPSSGPSLSRNGSRLVFDTFATNLAGNNTQPFGCSAAPTGDQPRCYGHVILYDRGTQFRLNLTQGATTDSQLSQISEDGNQVAFISRGFQSFSNNGSPTGAPGIIVMNLDTGQRAYSEIKSDTRPIISATGRWVAGGRNSGSNALFLRDMTAQPSSGNQPFLIGYDSSQPGEFSSDETRIVYSSATDTRLLPDANQAERDVYALDITALPNRSESRLTVGGNGPAGGPVTNADGTLLAFDSSASNFATDNNGTLYDVFLLDTSASAGERPVANGQALSVPAGESIEINLTGSEPAGSELLYELLSEPTQGTLFGTPPDLTYSPAQGFSGRDGFRFQVTANGQVSEPALIAIEVRPVSSQGFTLTATQRPGSREIDLVATWPATAVWTQVREFDGDSGVLWDGQAQTWTGTYSPTAQAETVTFNSRYWLPGIAASHESVDVTVVLDDAEGPVDPPASGLGGYAWFDANGDSLRGPTEAADADRSVTLYRCGTPWGVAATATSQATTGRFDFVDVLAGEYQIGTPIPADGFSPVAGDNIVYNTGFSNCFTFDGSDLNLGIALTGGTTPPPEPSENAITGFAWIDGNSDGTRNEGEAIEANRAVTLYRCSAPWGIAGSGVTSAEGLFSINGLEPGEYQLGTEVPAAGFSPLGADNSVHASGFTDCVGLGASIGIGLL